MSNQVSLKAIAEIAEVSLVQLIGFVNQHMDKYPVQFTPPLDGKASLHLEYVKQLLNDFREYTNEKVNAVCENYFGKSARCELKFNGRTMMGFSVETIPQNEKQLIEIVETMVNILKAPKVPFPPQEEL